MNEPLTSDSNAQTIPEAEIEELLQALRRKEGTWVEWGQACLRLQKAGYNPQAVFEATGFEPIQQNQIIVGSQVYASIVSEGAPPDVLAHFERIGSDSLYELRILTHTERAAAAEFLLEKKLDSVAAKDLARAMKDFSRLYALPEGFEKHPGDAAAYQCWKAAQQKADLQERSRLIAKGLQLSHSPTARQKIEQLLTDFTVTTSRSAPRLPLYRQESAEELPRILPVVGKLPLTEADLKAVPIVEETEPFRLVKFSGTGAWVPLPGWQVLMHAEDPIALLSDSEEFPALGNQPGDVLLVVNRAQREWNPNAYFIVATSTGQLQVQWFETAPDIALLGQLILIVRPKRILDESLTSDLWQIEE